MQETATPAAHTHSKRTKIARVENNGKRAAE